MLHFVLHNDPVGVHAGIAVSRAAMASNRKFVACDNEHVKFWQSHVHEIKDMDSNVIFKEGGYFEDLLEAMAEHPTLELQAVCCQILSIVSYDIPGRYCEQTIDLVVEAIRQFPYSDQLHMWGWLTLSRIPRIRETDRVFSKRSHLMNLTGLVLDSMKRYGTNASIQVAGCEILGRLLRCRQFRHMCKSQCTTVVLSAVKLHADRDVHEYGLSVLSCLCERFDNSIVCIVDNGGIECILNLMTADNVTDQFMIQHFGLSVLESIATFRDDYKRQMVECRAIEIIVKAMKECIEYHVVQSIGASILTSLVAFQEDYRLRIVDCQAIQVVIDGMEELAYESHVQKCGLEFLVNFLAFRKDYIQAMVEYRAIEVIIKGMLECNDDSDVQNYGCLALATIAADNDENAQRVVENEGVETIVHAHTCHKAYINASQALKNVAINPLAHQRIMRCPGHLSEQDRSGVAALLSVVDCEPHCVPDLVLDIIVRFITFEYKFGTAWF